MLKDTLVLVAALAVLGCADAPTEVGSATEAGAFRSMPAFAARAGGQVLYVVIPDVGAGLLPDDLLVATGRTGSLDINECDGFPVTAARYAVLTGARRESYDKVHFSTDVRAGTKMSKFVHFASCMIGGIAYEVYQVETQ